jgi:uncharacterized SAM-binding protein YcdF (DUF218 family)
MDLGQTYIEMLLTAPGIIIVLLLLTFLGYLKKTWLGTALLAVTTAALVALSLPLTAHWLLRDLQNFAKPPLLVPMAEKGPQAALFVPQGSFKDPPQAIVVLGANRYAEAPEYEYQDTVGPLGLERLRYAAWLQRKTGLPILVSGGTPGGESTPEAELMRAVLADELKATVKWSESQSRNTTENARFSQALLAENKIKHVYLVTHAWHMRRAARSFESVGLQVTPAPTGFLQPERHLRQVRNYLPSGWGLYLTGLALRERMAFTWSGLDEESAAGPAPKPAGPPASGK